ncbi:MAG TPA: hypothetical protein VGK40_09180, partial [Verrucomicrobiae bacterium]
MNPLFAALAILLCPAAGWPADSVRALLLNTRRLHLGTAGSPEWEEFAGHTPDARRLNLRFQAGANPDEATLFIRQDDVKQDWTVELNGRRLGKLFLMEADLIHAIRIPSGSLHEGENALSIIPPKEIDDIVLHEIRIAPRPVAEAVGEATLAVSVTDVAGNKPLPCRLTVVDNHGALAPLLGLTNTPLPEDSGAQRIAVRPGVVYTGNGAARFGLPAGDYTVYASRGFEWSVATQRVHVATGQLVRLSLQLQREVLTPGLVCCDTHVHTFTHSGHGDATIDERMLTLAGEGIELPIATDHNLHIDYSGPAGRMGVADWFTPVTGNEVTTAAGHFNIFLIEPGATVA